MIRNYKLRLLLTFLIIGMLSAVGAIASQSLPGVSSEDAKQIMPVSQLTRGMRGYGLTVFHGTKIEKFDFEVLGILKKMNTGKDLILVRVGGGPITKRQSGILAGMSGSPCYIKGKLIGAISYGSSFSKEPVGMITPIADMLEAWDTNLPKQASGYSSIQNLSEPASVDGKTVNGVSIDEPGEVDTGIDEGILHMEPLMTPLMVSGLSPRGMEQLTAILKPFHIKPMAGPGGGAHADAVKGNLELKPGAAVGVSLASGDVDMTGIGTLTYKRGNKIVAFGHPMLGIGAIDAPMSIAYIYDFISSYNVSTKLGSPIKTVGRIFQDRPWCIAGAIGDMAKTIPVKVSVYDESSKRKKNFNIQVINHPLLASKLATMAVGEAIYDMHPTPGDSTAEVTYNVIADQIGRITRTNTFFDTSSIESAAVSDVGTLMQMLSSNKFYPVDIKSVNVSVKISSKRNTAAIDRIFLKKSEYEPGETAEVGVVLRPYKQDRITKTFKIKIPATAADGKVTLIVRGGGMQSVVGVSSDAAVSSGDDDSAAMPSIAVVGSPIANADNVKQLVGKYLEREKNNDIVVQLMLRSTAINVAGEKLSGLPSAIADVMKSSRNSGLKLERDDVKESFKTDMIISGMAQLQLQVKHKKLIEGKPSAGVSSSVSTSVDDLPDATYTPSQSDGSVSDYYESAAGGPEVKMEADQPSVTVSEQVEDDDSSASCSAADGSGKDDDDSSKDTKADTVKNSSTPAAQTYVKTVVRQPKTWMQKSQVDFAKGTFSGVSASSENKLELAPTLRKVVDTSEQFVWSVAPSSDGVYAGTGNSGKIYHIKDNGEIKLYYETGELEVHALARDSKGNIYAATSPHGKIFKITPDGKGKLLYKTDEHYVLTLAVDKNDNIYAGVGDSGKVYKISPDGTGRLFVDTSEQQVLSLYCESNGSLLIGTGINGIVYRADKYGAIKPVFDANEGSITSVVSDSNGNIYAGTSPKGSIYKIKSDGSSETLYSKADKVFAMAIDKKDNIYAVSDGNLIEISPDKTVINLDSGESKMQFLSLSYNDLTGALYAGTGNIGSVYVSRCCDISGTYESAVHDAKMVSKWARIKWFADMPAKTAVSIQTRTGNVETPDGTWTDWSAPYTNSAGDQITNKDGRYIQYKVTLKTSAADTTPKISTVSISYMTPNQAPSVKLTSPTGGEIWSGKETIKWVGADPDNDSLSYDVYYSKDGKDWKSLVGGVNSSSSNDDKKQLETKIVNKVKTELDKSKDIPDDMKNAVIKDVKIQPNSQAADMPALVPINKPSTNSSYTWDTKSVDDGTYMIKVVASDKASNAVNALSDSAISAQITVCNTAPMIAIRKGVINADASGQAKISGIASAKSIEIAGVQYRVDGGDWNAAVPDEGMFDSLSSPFTIVTDKLSTGMHKLDIEAVDTAGNASTETIQIKVS